MHAAAIHGIGPKNPNVAGVLIQPASEPAEHATRRVFRGHQAHRGSPRAAPRHRSRPCPCPSGAGWRPAAPTTAGWRIPARPGPWRRGSSRCPSRSSSSRSPRHLPFQMASWRLEIAERGDRHQVDAGAFAARPRSARKGSTTSRCRLQRGSPRSTTMCSRCGRSAHAAKTPLFRPCPILGHCADRARIGMAPPEWAGLHSSRMFSLKTKFAAFGAAIALLLLLARRHRRIHLLRDPAVTRARKPRLRGLAASPLRRWPSSASAWFAFLHGAACIAHAAATQPQHRAHVGQGDFTQPVQHAAP